MKVPTYITIEQKKESKHIFDLVAEKYGLNTAMVAKKLMIAAAYGSMIKWKVPYDNFLKEFKKYIFEEHQSPIYFWGLSFKNQKPLLLFDIKTNVIRNGTMKELEDAIVKVYRNPEIYIDRYLDENIPYRWLNKQYITQYKQMFNIQ